jgi:hypothetical protein
VFVLSSISAYECQHKIFKEIRKGFFQILILPPLLIIFPCFSTCEVPNSVVKYPQKKSQSTAVNKPETVQCEK